ncbi:TIGR03769 domain-containing protein [Nanchangia anserum]|uniref:TIGR03769 domain-containing protein n=1 Tax=Nanchangia anserum TaxID=2692125 RepID=A0A8I0KUG5_9ACTO|nr:choice-of-anchor M domain-containing protein [Nanchangia anserum]MBD3689678.1 TIGR03769 domain-containing protein [Nanchangia anserum]QOX81855.1 TIGR03769 domain-containing protein [Nanchangia anserum]
MTRYSSRRLRALAAMLLATGLCFGGAALPAWADDTPSDPALQQVVSDNEPIDQDSTVVLDHGHCDLAPKLIDGTWKLMARDDTVSPSVWRPLDNVVFRVSDKAIMKLPEGKDYAFTGAKPGDNVYVVPQSEVAGVPWLGWSTQSPAVVAAADGPIEMIFEGHQGPGQFTNFYQAGNFGGPEQNWTSTTKEAQILHVDLNTHVHTNWVFTTPGVHLVRLTAKATLKDGTTVQDSQVVRFAVGEKVSAQQAADASWTTTAHSQAHPNDAVEAVGDTAESSHTVLIGVGIGLGVIGIIAIVVAVVVVRTSRSRQAAALARAAREVEQ